MIYEWDPKKAKANRASTACRLRKRLRFSDPLAVTYSDPDHSGEEVREITIGHSAKRRVVFLSHTQRGDRIRIIGARKVRPRERKQYEESIGEEKQ